MTVRTVWTPTGRYEVTGSGYAPTGALHDAAGGSVSADTDPALRWSLLAGAACNDAALTHQDGRWDIVGDPTEAALLVAAAKAGLLHKRRLFELANSCVHPLCLANDHLQFNFGRDR
jgi:cation-transporting ATPase F